MKFVIAYVGLDRCVFDNFIAVMLVVNENLYRPILLPSGFHCTKVLISK